MGPSLREEIDMGGAVGVAKAVEVLTVVGSAVMRLLRAPRIAI